MNRSERRRQAKLAKKQGQHRSPRRKDVTGLGDSVLNKFIKIPRGATNIASLPFKERIRLFQSHVPGCTWKQAKEMLSYHEKYSGTLWQNDEYCVEHFLPNELEPGWVRLEEQQGKIELLCLKRLDREPIRDWPTLQRIKNTVLPDGDKRYAIEIFPPESKLVDTANQYWLWVFPVDFDIGIGMFHRMVVEENQTQTYVPSTGQDPIISKQTFKETA